jgi:nucleotide-binding universal stress UspA family protein
VTAIDGAEHSAKERLMKSILVAYDDSDPSRRALERAAMLAEAFDSKVLVTSIAPLVHSLPKVPATPERERPRKATHQDVDTATATLVERGIDAEGVEATGDPASAIAMLAERRGVDLVVLGSRGLGPVQRLLGQSVSQAVSRRVLCDVLIVHPGPESGGE